MTWEQFEESLGRHTSSEEEKTFLRSQACAAIADIYYWNDEVPSTKRYYQKSLDYDRWNVKAHVKMLLLTLGKPGKDLRKYLRSAG